LSANLAIDAYRAKVVINPNLPGYRKRYQIPMYMTGSIYGLRSNLQSKRAAVVKFLQGWTTPRSCSSRRT
jgi:hypothetical protein